MQRTRRRFFRPRFPLALILALTSACTGDAPGALELEVRVDPLTANSSVSTPPGTASGEVTTLTSFDPFSGQLPESIAIDRWGNLYVSMSPLGEIWKLDPAGSFLEVVATFPLEGFFGVSGLRFDVRGKLYATNSSSHADARGVWEIGPDGQKNRIHGSESIPIPNDVAISPDGTLYITDSAGAVWRVLPGGTAEIWVEDPTLEGTGAYGLGFPIGANGIVVVTGSEMSLAPASDPGSAGGLVVANAEMGQVVHVPILPDGSAGQPTVVIVHPSLFGLDGITMDARGAIYGAANAGNKVVRISADGTEVSEIVSGSPLDFPTAVTFGTGREQHTLFVLNSAFIHALHDPQTLDEASPAVLTVHVGAPGASRR